MVVVYNNAPEPYNFINAKILDLDVCHDTNFEKMLELYNLKPCHCVLTIH